MSHFSRINAKVSDKEALTAATNKMGLSLISNGLCRYYYGTKKADIVIKLPGKYDVALKNEGSYYSMEADLFSSGGVEQYIGANAGLLMQRYSAEKTKIEAFKMALLVTESRDSGNIILTLTDPETGGQVCVTCYVGGKIDIKTTGFPGQSCMKFQDLENALGNRESFSPTMEMYEVEPLHENARVNNIIV